MLSNISLLYPDAAIYTFFKYRVGQKWVYSCEYAKYRASSCVIDYGVIFPHEHSEPTFACPPRVYLGAVPLAPGPPEARRVRVMFSLVLI